MTHRAKHARRSVACLSAVALSATVLAIGAAAPANAADPWDVDLTGRVVNSAGAGLGGIYVVAYTTPSNGSTPQWVSSTYTDESGTYSFYDLDPASLEDEGPAVKDETDFKLFFYWSPEKPADYHSVGYLNRGLGGTKTVRKAQSVAIPAGAAATAPTQALPTAGGVIVKLTGPTGAPVRDGSVSLLDAGANDPFEAWSGNGGVWSDDPFYPWNDDNDEFDAPRDGLVYIRGLEPASYLAQGHGYDTDPVTEADTYYVPRFYGGDGSFAKASKIAVKAGEFTQITLQLGTDLLAQSKPRIIGDTSFGSTLKADPGVWLGGYQYNNFVVRSLNYEYEYQWLRGSTVVGTGETYKLSKADKGKKIRLVVTAYSGDYTGTAASAKSPKVGQKSRVKVLGIAGKKVTVSVKAAKEKFGPAKGKVVLVTADGTVASKKVKVKGGVATLTVRNKYVGEKLFVVYLGGGNLGSDTAAVKGGKGKKKK